MVSQRKRMVSQDKWSKECDLSTQNRWSLNTRGWALKTKLVVSQDKAGGLSTQNRMVSQHKRGWSLKTKQVVSQDKTGGLPRQFSVVSRKNRWSLKTGLTV